MKKGVFFVLFFYSLMGFGQVGINTTSPSTTLDVNGDVRIRSLNGGTMVSDEMGNLTSVPFKVMAAGKVHPNGTIYKATGATVSRLDRGHYRVNFSSAMSDSNYIVMLSIKDCGGNCNGNASYDDPGISYYNQNVSGFNINIGDSDNGNVGKVDVDLEFMFIVYAI